MLRLLGLVGLVAAMGLAGILKAAELKDRILLLEDFYKMVLELKSQMQYFREPLLRMFERTGQKGDTRAHKLLMGCLAALHQGDGSEEIGQIWEEAVKGTYRGTPLTDDDKTLLLHLGTFIGQTDYENQRMQFAYLEERLTEQMEEAREIYKKKGPMYRRIGFFIGAIAALAVL